MIIPEEIRARTASQTPQKTNNSLVCRGQRARNGTQPLLLTEKTFTVDVSTQLTQVTKEV